MMWLLLACSPGFPPAPEPACPGSSEVLGQEEVSSLGFSAQQLHAALPETLPLPVAWSEEWGPPAGISFEPVLHIGELSATPELVTSAHDCQERLVVPVQLALTLADEAPFRIQGLGQLSGTPDAPHFELGFTSGPDDSPDPQAREWILAQRQAQYALDSTSDRPDWYGIHALVSGGSDSGRLLVAQQWTNEDAWSGPRVLFQGGW
ncbi:MAG: hypothetical protein VX899_04005 [Myxococcota bacterium]|nr:hypothetical protein [Myxococcota bacterium]